MMSAINIKQSVSGSLVNRYALSKRSQWRIARLVSAERKSTVTTLYKCSKQKGISEWIAHHTLRWLSYNSRRPWWSSVSKQQKSEAAVCTCWIQKSTFDTVYGRMGICGIGYVTDVNMMSVWHVCFSAALSWHLCGLISLLKPWSAGSLQRMWRISFMKSTDKDKY